MKSLEQAIPEVWSVSQIYWSAFQILSQRRDDEEGIPRYIQMREIVAYADIVGYFPQSGLQDLLTILLDLDAVYVAHVTKKVVAAREKAARKASR